MSVRGWTSLALAAGVGLTCWACSGPAAGPASPPPSPRAPAPPPAQASPVALPGADYGADARLLYRVLACAGEAPLPPTLDAATVTAHCAEMRRRIEGYQKRYLATAGPFLARLRPADTPATVVYPFGGGDLLSALTTYPDATEVTTLSLEQSGDPRRLAGLDKQRLGQSLQLVRQTIAPLLALNDSTSENLMKGQQGEIPGQLGFFVVALAVHGYEPVHARYFRIEDDGRLHYYDAAEVEKGDDETARSLKGSWTPPDFAPIFANVELAYRRAGAGPDAPLHVHRHIGANLADGPLRKRPGLLRYLEARGQVAAMTKAASYLLWRPDFSVMRRYLLEHATLMISDSTGIPPAFARKAGFEQETYGRFAGSFLPADAGINQAFRELWKAQPARPLPFRYGYIDEAHSYHLLVMRKARAKGAAS